MITMSGVGRTFRRGLSVATIGAGALAAAGTVAFAGQCPADKVVADGRGQPPGATQSTGVTDTVLASIDLGKEIGVAGRHLRIRELVIEPGGVVAWHTHRDRPALIHIIEGRIVEYSSSCAVPIVHQAGDVSKEENGLSHWWRNEGTSVVRLTSSDVLHADPMNMANRMK